MIGRAPRAWPAVKPVEYSDANLAAIVGCKDWQGLIELIVAHIRDYNGGNKSLQMMYAPVNKDTKRLRRWRIRVGGRALDKESDHAS